MTRDNIIYNKVSTIRRCLDRINTTYTSDKQVFKDDFDKQDVVVLNLQRICQALIDIANHVLKEKRLGLPQSSKESFELLERAKLIDSDLSESLQKMVGFRNIAVHEYQRLNLDIIHSIMRDGFKDVHRFAALFLDEA